MVVGLAEKLGFRLARIESGKLASLPKLVSFMVRTEWERRPFGINEMAGASDRD